MAHLYVFAMKDIPRMVLFVKMLMNVLKNVTIATTTLRVQILKVHSTAPVILGTQEMEIVAKILMNAFFKLTTVTIMLNVITQMAHLHVFAIWDIQGMVLAVKVSGIESETTTMW
ncbi:Hypothetical predicted protein [Paramuricea clavata]|nr:Hypothetical predicted protein [Paramuricea clavata]